MKLHRRQFIIGPKEMIVNRDWRAIKISPTLFISYCSQLPLSTVTDLKGNVWVIIGVPIQTIPYRLNPKDEIANCITEQVETLYGEWTGRWVLFGNNSIHVDAGGTLGCFYRTIECNEKTDIWISSSPSLISNIQNVEVTAERAPVILDGKGMDWYPPPRSRFQAIHRLLPSQILILRPDKYHVVYRSSFNRWQAKSNYDEILDYLQEKLVTAIKSISQHTNEIWLPLTSGYDSRLLLAASHFAGIHVKTYTQYYPSISNADWTLPAQLSKELSYEHHFIRRNKVSSERMQMLDAHTQLHCVGEDRGILASGQFDFLQNRSAYVLRGGVFEVGRCFYYNKLPRIEKLSETQLTTSIYNCFKFDKFHKHSSSHYNGIREWVKWFYKTGSHSIDWRDHFYLEQRVSGWLSSQEQCLDITGNTNIHIANCQSFISALLSIPEDKRRHSQHHVDLINRLAPQLLKYPFNPK